MGGQEEGMFAKSLKSSGRHRMSGIQPAGHFSLS